MAQLYERLELFGFGRFEPALRRYVESLQGYRKNRYEPLPPTTRARVAETWRRSFEEWGKGCHYREGEEPARAMTFPERHEEGPSRQGPSAWRKGCKP